MTKADCAHENILIEVLDGNVYTRLRPVCVDCGEEVSMEQALGILEPVSTLKLEAAAEAAICLSIP